MVAKRDNVVGQRVQAPAHGHNPLEIMTQQDYSYEKPGLFERRSMSAGKLPPWNRADTTIVSFVGLVILVCVITLTTALL